MRESLLRLAAIVGADVRIRLRRPSTAVLFVLISIIPYMWIPAPSTGRTLMQIGNSRVLYNSAAIGIGTAMLASLFIGLAGYYVISNAIRRDVASRCGFVIASTTIRGSEYIIGKFVGNVAFLTIFTTGYMATAMGMVVVRGEGPLEPFVFAWQYLLILPPTITFVSAIALAFECTPLLRSKMGDVAYFFVFVSMMGGVSATIAEGAGARWASYFDISGVAFVVEQIKVAYGTTELSIGSSRFDAAIAPVVFTGLKGGASTILPRVGATLWPLAMLVVARVFFHRFDPAKVRAIAGGSGPGLLGRLNFISKPIARAVVGAGAVAHRLPGTLVRASAVDALATIGAFPLTAVAALVLAVVSLAVEGTSLAKGVLPVAFAACAIAIADIACRERKSGTMALVFAAPRLRERFVLWKFGSSICVAAAFLTIPLARAIAFRPESAPALITGVVFMTALATGLGIISANSKTFTVVFLTFAYVVLSDAGHSPALDFAGWFGVASPVVTLAYGALAISVLITAQFVHAHQLRARW